MQHHQRLSSRLAVWRPAPELSQLTPPLSADDSHCQEHCDRHWRPAKVPHACKSLGSLPSPHSVSGCVFVLISPPLPLSVYLSMSATHWVCLSLSFVLSLSLTHSLSVYNNRLTLHRAVGVWWCCRCFCWQRDCHCVISPPPSWHPLCLWRVIMSWAYNLDSHPCNHSSAPMWWQGIETFIWSSYGELGLSKVIAVEPSQNGCCCCFCFSSDLGPWSNRTRDHKWWYILAERVTWKDVSDVCLPVCLSI